MVKLDAKLRIRAVFATTLVVFAVELLCFVRGNEPYPALIMPSFPGHPLHDGVLVHTEPAIGIRFTDGRTTSVPFNTILPPSPLDSSSVFRAGFFGDVTDPDTVAWLRSRICDQFPGETPDSIDITWRVAKYSDGPTRYTPVRTIRVDFT